MEFSPPTERGLWTHDTEDVWSPHGYWAQGPWTLQFSPPSERVLVSLWWYLESPRIMVPESLNIAVFTTNRKRACVTWLWWSGRPHGFCSQNHCCRFHHLLKECLCHVTPMVLKVSTDSSLRTTEPCSFHHLQKEDFDHITWLRWCSQSTGIPVPESLNPAVFTTIERGLWWFLGSLLIPFPESVSFAVFLSYRRW